MRRLAASSISSADRCAAPVTIIKEGTTEKCYPSPEYNLLPITWTVQRTMGTASREADSATVSDFALQSLRSSSKIAQYRRPPRCSTQYSVRPLPGEQLPPTTRPSPHRERTRSPIARRKHAPGGEAGASGGWPTPVDSTTPLAVSS